MKKRLASWATAVILVAMACAAGADDGGFVASFAARHDADGRHRLHELARSDAGPGDRGRQVDPERAWQATWLDAEGRSLRQARIPDPMLPLLGGRDPSQPLLVRFEDHPGAVLLELRDADGIVRGEVPLDAAARDVAAERQRAFARRFATSLGQGAKRAGDPPAIARDAAAALARQVDHAQRRRADAESRCAARDRRWHAPELVVGADACGPAPPAVSSPPAALPKPVARPAPVRRGPVDTFPAGAGRTPDASARDHRSVDLLADAARTPSPGRGKLVPVPRVRADGYRITGRVTFPAGATPPTQSVAVYAWGAPGPGYGYVNHAAPPDFAFDFPSVAGATVDLEARPPAPFLPVTVPLGVVDADVRRDILLALGVTVTGRVVFPAGSTPPATEQWLYQYDGDRYEQPIVVVPPDFAYRFAVDPGTHLRLSYAPPAPFQRVDADWGVVSSDTVRDLPVTRGVVVTGTVVVPVGESPPTESFWVALYRLDGNPESVGWVSITPPALGFEITGPPGVPLALQAWPPSPFLADRVDLGTPSGDLSVDMPLRRGAVVSGRLRFPANVAPPAGPVSGVLWDVDATGYGYGVTMAAPDFAFAQVVEPGSSPRLQVDSPLPFMRAEFAFGPVAADRSVTVPLQRGVVVTGDVVGPSYYRVGINDSGGASGWGSEPGTPGFDVALSPRDEYVEVTAPGYLPAAPVRPAGGADTRAEFRLAALATLADATLDLREPGGAALAQARVEAWRDGRFVVSGISGGDGRVVLELAPGAYELKVWPDTEQANQWSWDTTRLFAAPAIAVPLAVAGPLQTTLVAPASAWLDVRLQLPAGSGWPGCADTTPTGRLELLRDGRVVARGPFRAHYPHAGGAHRLLTGPGMFTVRFAAAGDVLFESQPFRAGSVATVPLARVGDVPPKRWTGTLRNRAGTAVRHRDIGVSDELGIRLWPNCPARTDAAGRFSLPLCAGCVYEFKASADDAAQRRIVRVDGPVEGSREQDVALGPPVLMRPMADTGVTRVHGHADAPFRLIFLAEGYVAERETWTDSNGNGLWDGVQHVDVDGDGLYDAGEPVAVYGDAAFPQEGTDPRAGSEVIQDLNGDGVLSLDDRALFERNIRDYLRGLFSSDQFAAWRGAYQAHALMTYSAQAGMDHGTILRDTAFGAEFSPERGLIGIDYSAAAQAAASALPGYTAVVVLINQPVPYGRVNSFILASGGVLGGDVNDTVAAHEFGHNPGGLADEYSEFAATWRGGELGGGNVTRFVDRPFAPWGDGVDPALDGRPSKPWIAEEGFFEGAGYHVSGAFRPAHASMMRFMDSLLFNRVSKARLHDVHARAMRDWPGRLAVDDGGDRCGRFAATWDVTPLGVSSVQLRAGAHDGPVIGEGAGAGSWIVRQLQGDLYLLDADSGMVLDIATAPLLRCTQDAGPAPPDRRIPGATPPARPVPGTPRPPAERPPEARKPATAPRPGPPAAGRGDNDETGRFR